MGSYTGGKWQSLPEKLAAQATGSKGPSSRGGKRKAPDISERALFKAEIARQAALPAGKQTAKPAKASATKAKPTMTRGSMKRAEGTAKVADVQNKIEAPAKSGLSKAKRDIKVGGLLGRTGGKWHLGKKVGKG